MSICTWYSNISASAELSAALVWNQVASKLPSRAVQLCVLPALCTSLGSWGPRSECLSSWNQCELHTWIILRTQSLNPSIPTHGFTSSQERGSPVQFLMSPALLLSSITLLLEKSTRTSTSSHASQRPKTRTFTFAQIQFWHVGSWPQQAKAMYLFLVHLCKSLFRNQACALAIFTFSNPF